MCAVKRHVRFTPQKRTCAVQLRMSALGKADIFSPALVFRFLGSPPRLRLVSCTLQPRPATLHISSTDGGTPNVFKEHLPIGVVVVIVPAPMCSRVVCPFGAAISTLLSEDGLALTACKSSSLVLGRIVIVLKKVVLR
jgi:hypothetical protein